MKKSLLMFLTIILIFCACGNNKQENESKDLPSEQISTSIESEVPEESVINYSTKEELLFNTKYTLHDDWTVNKLDYEDGSGTFYQILLQNEDTDTSNNMLLISTIMGTYYENLEQAKADGYSETDLCKRQDVVDRCFKTAKDALLTSSIIAADYSEELFDLPETPVMHLKGIREEYNHEVYLFMDDYSNVAIVQAYLTDTALSAEIRNMIDNLKFSYNGWKEKSTSSNSSSSEKPFTNKYGTPTTKCHHSGCNNYIASSGDTNCCEKHSNKCLNCGKYIDEDATYCWDCLSDNF